MLLRSKKFAETCAADAPSRRPFNSMRVVPTGSPRS
jgi:hypothetical protein